jgi:5'-nucleotidase
MGLRATRRRDSNTGVTNILVTNDDGINSPTLFHLKRALETAGKVTVIAPDRQWTASGHAKTMHKPLRVNEVELSDGSPAYVTNGAPSDCVALAVLGFLPQLPNLVVSGINLGANVGHNITYSSTIAAAIEGTISGIHSIAASLDSTPLVTEALDTYEGANFRYASQFVAGLAQEVLAHGLPPKVFLNVNVPDVAPDEITEVEITRLGRGVYRDKLIERQDPRGQSYYWIGGERPSGFAEDEGTDMWALAHKRISITPIHLDMTAHEFMEELKSWKIVR